MASPEQPGPASDPSSRLMLRLLSCDWRAAFLAAVATIVIELGVFLVAWRADVPLIQCAIASLAIACVWTAIASPCLAAGAEGWLGGLLRGGAVADASLALLAVLWLVPERGRMLGLAGAAEAYCALAAMALAGVAAARLARRRAGRFIAAAVFAVVLAVVLFSPLWTSGLLKSEYPAVRQATVTLAVGANPLYSVFSTIAPQTGFVWHKWGLMYELTAVGDYASPPPMPWYVAALFWLGVAAVLASWGIARHRRPKAGT